MDISSLAKVNIELITKAATDMLDHIKERRTKLREECIVANMEEKKSWFGMVTTPGMTREEAETYVDAPVEMFEPFPRFRIYAHRDKSTAKELLNMCEVSCEDNLYLGVEHVEFIARASK